MNKKQIKDLLPAAEFNCHVDLYGSNRYWHKVTVNLGTKDKAMEIINNNGGNAKPVIGSSAYSDIFVVEK